MDLAFEAFDDRADAGRRLAARMEALCLHDPVIVALPRGGVPVATVIARALGAPLRLLLVRKIGAPWQPELALGAVVDGSPPRLVVDLAMLEASGVPVDQVEAGVPAAVAEIERRRAVYGVPTQMGDLAGREVVVVDDGLATGATARAALQALAQQGVQRLVLAVPVAAPSSLDALRPHASEIVCLHAPAGFEAVSRYYRRFDQLEDREVIALLDAARGQHP